MRYIDESRKKRIVRRKGIKKEKERKNEVDRDREGRWGRKLG